MWCGARSCLITVFSPFAHPTSKGVIHRKYLLLAHKARSNGMKAVYDYMWCGTTSGMTRNLEYLSTVDMDHKRCKNGPKTPQIYIVQPTPVHIVSYFIYYLAFKYF